MNASKMLARLQRALAASGLTVTAFLKQSRISKSAYYKIKTTKLVTPRMHKRLLEAIKSQEPSLAETIDVAVNSPPHYKLAKIECIDAMVQVYGQKRVQEYAEITAFKYQWREGLKGSSATDKQKKIWYTRYSMGDDPRGNDRE